MQQTILWTGIAYYSLEHCMITPVPSGSAINSVIIGRSDNIIYRVDYNIITNHQWETTSFIITMQLDDKVTSLSYHGDGKGNWSTNGVPAPHLSGCIDIDITLTPFTNTLPVKRLNLPEGEQQQISVLYIDVLEQELKPVRQCYTRLSGTEYRFENVPNDFEAIITMDEHRLVSEYPGLFTRTAIHVDNLTGQ